MFFDVYTLVVEIRVQVWVWKFTCDVGLCNVKRCDN